MKIQTFNKLLFLLFLFSFNACQQPSKVDEASIEKVEDANPGLSEAQMKMAGIELGIEPTEDIGTAQIALKGAYYINGNK